MSATLLERIARGDPDAVPECLDRYGGLVWALARKHSADLTDAEDAAQDVFIDVWRCAARFDPAVGPEATFVAMIARRRLADRARRQARSLPMSALPPGGGPAPPAGDRAAVADEVALVRSQMAVISPDQRTVLELAIDRGMTQADIAAALGMPLGTVKAHARRGLLRLRALVHGRPLPAGGER